MVEMNGLVLEKRISRSPVAHLFCWINEADNSEGAQPRNAGGLSLQRALLQPLA